MPFLLQSSSRPQGQPQIPSSQARQGILGNTTLQGDNASSFNNTQLILEIELMFSDLLNHGGPEKFQLQGSSKEIEEKVEFKSVSF